jgi:hypothetical protein
MYIPSHLKAKSIQPEVAEKTKLVHQNEHANIISKLSFNLNSIAPNSSKALPVQAKLIVNTPGDEYEQEADAMADKVMRLQQHGGSGVSNDTRSFMSDRFGFDFSKVKIHTDSEAVKMNREMGARAFTLGNDIYFNSGEYQPGSLAGKQLLAHELSHTLQQAPSGLILRKTLTDLPEATRKGLKISRAVPKQTDMDPWIKNYFDPKSGTSVTSGITTEFGAEITDAQQQKGLRSIAVELVWISKELVTPATGTEPEKRSNTDPEGWPLPANSILDIALDLLPYKSDHAIFRFTRYADGSVDTVLIEKTHVIAPAKPAGTAPAPASQPQPAAGPAASFTGTVSVGNVKVVIDSGFGDARGKIITEAVRLLPGPIMALVDGVTIGYEGAGSGPDGQNGDYKEDEDRVRIWGNMFDNSPRRMGTATNTAYGIVHELGHAIELRPLFKAQLAQKKAETEKKDLEKKLKNPPVKFDINDPLGELKDDPNRKAEETRLKDEISKLEKEIEAQNKAMADAKSIAGNELGKDTEKLLTDFGKAIETDGVKVVQNAKKRNREAEAANKKAEEENAANPNDPQKPMKAMEKTLSTGISNYAATDLMEAFAENFSAYVLDEALFKAIRPNTYAYFVKAFPKTAATSP